MKVAVKTCSFPCMEKFQLQAGCLNPFQWKSLHCGMPLLHKTNKSVCIGMTVEGQICSGNLLHCATILFLTLAAVSIGGNEKQLWRSSFVASFFFFFLPWMEFLQWKLVHWSVLVWNYHPFSVIWCSAWAASALYHSASEESVIGRFQPCGIPAVPGSSGESIRKQELKHLLFGWSREQSQGELWDQHTCMSILRGRWDSSPETPACWEFRRNLATKSKLQNSSTFVVNKMRTVLSTLLIGAVYQIELSAASRVGPAHYECPASTILVKILYAAVDSQVC